VIGGFMDRQRLFISLLLLPIITAACFLKQNQKNDPPPTDEFSQEEIETYTAELISEGFQFCPDMYLEIHIDQIHEIPQFNFMNHVSANGQLSLVTYGTEKVKGLKTKGTISITGDGWTGICLFKSSGIVSLDLTARLIPGETGSPNLLISGQCEQSISTKPPCGDFGMIPFEKTVFIVMPYRDGESIEWTWKNRSAGVSGSSKWVLHLPCE
jgi:hypothetical protein